MLWELSLTDDDNDRRIIPVFVNENMVLRPVAGKRIMDVFLDQASRLTVSSVPNLAADAYEQLEQMSMDFCYLSRPHANGSGWMKRALTH